MTFGIWHFVMHWFCTYCALGGQEHTLGRSHKNICLGPQFGPGQPWPAVYSPNEFLQTRAVQDDVITHVINLRAFNELLKNEHQLTLSHFRPLTPFGATNNAVNAACSFCILITVKMNNKTSCGQLDDKFLWRRFLMDLCTEIESYGQTAPLKCHCVGAQGENIS